MENATRTSAEITAFIDEMTAIAESVKARRDKFNDGGSMTSLNECMIDAKLGNIIHSIHQIKVYANAMRDGAILGEAYDRAAEDAVNIGLGRSPEILAAE